MLKTVNCFSLMVLMLMAAPLAAQDHETGGGGGCGDVYGDLIHVVRDDATGQPVLARRFVELPKEVPGYGWGYCKVAVAVAKDELGNTRLNPDGTVMLEELDFLQAVDAEARTRGAEVLLGILEHDFETGSYHNILLTLGGENEIYRKRHLVPFGEFFPVPEFVRRWMRLMNLPYTDFAPGRDDPPHHAGQERGERLR